MLAANGLEAALHAAGVGQALAITGGGGQPADEIGQDEQPF